MNTYAMVMIVLPLPSSAMEAWMFFSVSESSDAVASSINMILGDLRIARAIAICRKTTVSDGGLEHYRDSDAYPLLFSSRQSESPFSN